MFYRISNDEGLRKKYTNAFLLGECEESVGACLKCGYEVECSLNPCNTNPMVLIKENYADFIPYYVSFNIVSMRFKEIAEHEGLVGLTFERAEIISADDMSESDKRELRTDGVPLKKAPPEYYKLNVKYGAVYHERSKIIVKSFCDKCGTKIYATKGHDWVESGEEYPDILDAKSIRGYDIFMAEGYGITHFCTERFYSVYKKYNLTGLLFTPIDVL